MSTKEEEREVRKQRQKRKMTKILTKAWGLDRAEPFQEVSADHSTPTTNGRPRDLTTMGQNLENGVYSAPGKRGWEQFALDIGSVYNRFIMR